MKGVLIKDKEADTVASAVYMHWVLGLKGLGFGVPTKHVYSDSNLVLYGQTRLAISHTAMVLVRGTIGQ